MIIDYSNTISDFHTFGGSFIHNNIKKQSIITEVILFENI